MKIAEKNRILLEKLRGLPEKKKKIILWATVAVFAVILGYFWVQGTIKNISKINQALQESSILKIGESLKTTDNQQILEVKTGTEDWQTYKNEEYGYEIKYPTDFAFREYISGVAFYQKDNKNESGDINVGFYKRGENYCSISFDDYVRIAGPSEIQNYESLNSIEKITNSSGTETYIASWNYVDLQGNEKVSLPIAYFNAGVKACGTIEAFLNSDSYPEVFAKMISTFKFVK